MLATKYYFVAFEDLTIASQFMTELSDVDIGTTIFSKNHSDSIGLRK